MITVLLCDFSRVLLFPKDESYKGELNALYRKFVQTPGYRALDYFRFNEELLQFFEEKRTRYELYVFTAGIAQDAPDIKERLDLIFLAVFSAEELGVKKSDPKTYQLIASKIKKNPRDILFVDDNEINVTAARSAGVQAIQFKNNQQFFRDFEDIEK